MVGTRPKSGSLARPARWGLALVCLVLPAVTVGYWLSAKRPPEEYFQQGLDAFRENRLELLQASAEALAAYPGYEPHSQLLEGMVHLRSGQLPRALDCFWHARNHDDTRQLAFSLSGEAFYRLGNHREAIRILTVAIEADPENVQAHRWAAAACYDIGAMDRALSHLQKVAELDPSDPRPRRLSGLIHKDFERYELAVAEYREALRLHQGAENWDEVRVELAWCLRREGQFAEALAVLESCAETPDVDALRAECHLALERVEQAAEFVGRALNKDARHRDALLVQAEIMLQTGRAADAAEILQRAAVAHPRDDLVRYRLAQVYRRLGREAQAEEQAAIMRELRELGRQFTKLHERAFNDVADAELRYQLGQMAEQLGRPLLAVSWYEATLALDPSHRAAREAWEKLTRPPEPAAKEPAAPAAATP